MPFDKPLPSDGIPEAPHSPESGFGNVKPDIHMQLSKPQDIAAANQFFKPPSVSKFLPDISTGPSALTPSGAEAIMPTGAEHAVLGPAGAIPGAIPGAEPMSPLIQMIMKMPGHISLMSSFFEMLGAFFSPMQDAISGMLEHTMNLGGEHLSALGDSAMELADGGGELGLDFGMLPDEAPILNEFSPTLNAFDHNLMATGPVSVEEFYNKISLEDAFANSPSLEVGGSLSPGKEMFETPGSEVNFAPNQGGFNAMGGNYMAVNPQNYPNNAFGSTVGSQSSGTLNYSQVTAPPSNYAGSASPSLSREGGMSAGSPENAVGQPQPGQSVEVNQGAQAGQGAEAGSEQPAAENVEPSTSPYTVKAGDNLWDIAREHLGDGARWGEIYHLNEGLLGSNPRLIMPGTEIQLPTDSVSVSDNAMNDYTVSSGDNLWDISKDHLGGGQHWPDLYKENTEVIGNNPNLIHPGQHLRVDGAEHGGGLAEHGQTLAGHGQTLAGHGHNLAAHPNQMPAHQTTVHHAPTHHPNSHQVAEHGTHLGSTPHAQPADHIAKAPLDKAAHSPKAEVANAPKPESSKTIAMTNLEDLNTSQIELSAQAQSLNAPFGSGTDGTHQPLN